MNNKIHSGGSGLEERNAVLVQLLQLEKVVREIGTSPFPRHAFRFHQDRLARFLDFLARRVESFPGFCPEGAEPGPREEALADLRRKMGGLVRLQKDRFQALDLDPPADQVEYFDFCASMLELIHLCERSLCRGGPLEAAERAREGKLGWN